MHPGGLDRGQQLWRPHVDTDPALTAPLYRQAEEAKGMPYRGQLAPPVSDVAQQGQRPARDPFGGRPLPDRVIEVGVIHHWYGFLACSAFLMISATLRSVNACGSGSSRSAKTLRASSTVGSSLSSTCSIRPMGTRRACRRLAISSRL